MCKIKADVLMGFSFPFIFIAFSYTNHPSIVSLMNIHTHPDMVYCVYHLSRQPGFRLTLKPLIPHHNAPSQANTWDHNAATAKHAALHMPAQKIAMTRNQQKTDLFTVCVRTGHQTRAQCSPSQVKMVTAESSTHTGQAAGPMLT